LKKLVVVFVVVVFFMAASVVALPLIFTAASTPAQACLAPGDTTGRVSLKESAAFNAYFGKPWVGRIEERKDNARRIIEIGNSRNESAHSIQTALETAMQESGLLNLPKGDRDSLGLFQQRPSKGWGAAAQILNVTDSTTAFYNALDRVPNKDSLSHKDAAIAVQIPSLEAYSSWNWDEIGNELVSGATAETCAQAQGARLPVKEGYIVSSGGAFNDPGYSGVKPHKGIDLSGYSSGSLGKPVFAAFSGTVVTSAIGQGCTSDNSVTIVQNEGFKVTYMHMNGSDITVRVGDTVSAGDTIGAIGNCGNSTGPHLHFEVEPGTDKEAWINSIPKVSKFGSTFLDPVAVMAHFGVDLTP